MFAAFKFNKFYERLLRQLGYQKVDPNGITRDDFFGLYFSLRRPFTVQIGANDGMTHDSLHQFISKYSLPALMVEPQPDVFSRLKENYKNNPNIRFANTAVGDSDGNISFYRINPELVLPGKEYKASSGSSLDRDQVLQNVIRRIPPYRTGILRFVSRNPDDYIEEISVPVMKLETLLRTYGVTEIGLFFTDCQGADFSILKQFDFTRFTPDVINFEHALLTPDEYSSSRKVLDQHGYRYFESGADTCAYRLV